MHTGGCVKQPRPDHTENKHAQDHFHGAGGAPAPRHVRLPASADASLTELEQAVVDAQAEVDRLGGVVADLEEELEEAERELAAAIEDRDEKAQAVSDVEQAVADAEAELAAAIIVRDILEAEWLAISCEGLTGTTTPTRPQCNYGKQAAESALADATANVAVAEAELVDAQDELAAALTNLAASQAEVDAAQAEVHRINEELQQARAELAAAEVELANAQAELEAYVPASNDRHNGCNGIENAHKQVTANKSNGNKGKAVEVLTGVAGSFNCSI